VLEEVYRTRMHQVEIVPQGYVVMRVELIEYVGGEIELIEIVQVATALALTGEVPHDLHEGLGREHALLLHQVHFEVDPQKFVVDAEDVKELRRLHVGFLVLKGNQVLAQLAQELLEGGRLEIFVLELSGIADEYLQSDRNVLL
jgi:hypothetical protein